MATDALELMRSVAGAQEGSRRGLLEPEARMFKQALCSIRKAVSITDTQDKVVFVNESFLRLYGLGEEEILERPIAVVRSPRSLPQTLREIPLATARGGWEGELWNCRRDGTEFLISLTTAPAVEAQGMIADLREMSSTLSELLSLSISNLRLSETLSIQSIRDPLTGLFNRRYMEETLEREIYRAARKQNQIGVVMADIDHFKTFNDLHGHAAGDLVLAELAGLLKTRMRGIDIPCRFGGEEFALVFVESSLEDTIVRARELKEEVKQLKLSHAGEEIGSITLSVGVSAYPANGTKPEELLRSADAALYRAKQAGRDRVVSAGCP